MDTIEVLAAKQEIAELHYKYAEGVDKKDWKTFQSIFHDYNRCKPSARHQNRSDHCYFREN